MSDEVQSGIAPAVSRKRAAQACLACRLRKVRCDVTERGPPCMHCRLDHGDCVVKARPAKYRKVRAHSHSDNLGFSEPEAPKWQETAQQLNETALVEEMQLNATCIPVQVEARTFEMNPELPIKLLHRDTPQPIETKDVEFAAQSFVGESEYTPANSKRFVEPTLPHSAPRNIESEPRTLMNTHVLYSYYPFIELDSLPYMTPEDVNFLESQGCFRVPIRPLLDHFIQEYFLHVHPGLPIVDESIFWELYTNWSSHLAEHPYISLFVFQAMIFSSSCFVPLEIIQKLGFADARSARAAYYRRAKLLFDFEGDRDPIATGQGALLLSYHPPLQNHHKINTFWLGIAIQFAKDAGAHRYHVCETLSPNKRNILKRLWWCCILRDRIISLGVRRPLQISSSEIFSHQLPLSVSDLQTEVGRSKVYSPNTKILLNQLTAALCELAVVLTEVIMLVYPLHEPIDFILTRKERAIRSLELLVACRSSLTGWFKKIFMTFPQPSRAKDVHKSVILYTDLMYIYYHSAIVAISQFEILLSAKGPIIGDIQRHRICRSKALLEEAAGSFTDIFKELNRLQLTRYLPISVVAYAALPLVLHILDVKLATTEIQKARKQKRLKIYTETMKVFRSQYDVTKEVSDITSRMINYVSLERPGQRTQLSITNNDVSSRPQEEQPGSGAVLSFMPEKAPSLVNDWGGVLLRQTSLYLRITLTIDLALERGQFPNDGDFPIALQWQNTTTTRFPIYRITMGNANTIDDFNSQDKERGRENQHGPILNDMPNNDHTTNSAASLNYLSPSTDSFICEMQSMSADGEINQNDDLEFSADLGSFEMGGPSEGDLEFTCTATWPDEAFITSVY